MTHRIAKSRVRGTDFAEKVDAFAQDMTAWRTHMRNVEKDPGTYQAYPSPVASPDVVQSVASIDGETFVPDFEIFDDGPTPAQVLRLKQDHLLKIVYDLEAQAAHAVLPVGKRRLFNMRVADVRKRDVARRSETVAAHQDKVAKFQRHIQRQQLEHSLLVSETVRKANEAAVEDMLKNKEKILKNPDKQFKFGMSASELADHIEKTCGNLDKKIGTAPELPADIRPADDQALVDESEKAQDRIDAIERHAAELQHQIEDLTAETIDAWAPAPFPT